MFCCLCYSSLIFFFCSSMYLNSFFSMNSGNLHLLILFPLVFLLVNTCFQSFFSYLESLSMKFLLLIATLVGFCFSCDNSFLFLLMLESCVFLMLFSFILFSKDKDKLTAVFFMITFNILGSLPFMFYVFLLDEFFLEQAFLFFSPNLLKSVSLCLFCCLMFLTKVPLFFFHFWLTKAHVSGSGSCSMILASIMLKLGTCGLYNFAGLFYLSFLGLKFLCCSLLGCLFFIFCMIRFVDLKFSIACSSVVHMAFVPFLCLENQFLCCYSSVLMMVAHGFVSLFLFFLVTLIYEGSHNRSFDLNKALGGFSKFLLGFFSVFIFLNLGVPPFMGFFCEFFFCFFLLSYSYLCLFFFCTVMVLMVIFTMNFLIKLSFGKKNLFIIKDVGPKFFFDCFLCLFFLTVSMFF